MMDPSQSLMVRLRTSSLPATVAAVALYVTFEAGRHSFIGGARGLVCGLVCRVAGAWRTAIQSRFASSKFHFLHLLPADSTAVAAIPILVMIWI